MKDLKDQSIGMNINQKSKTADDNNVTRSPLDASFQGLNRLFVLAFDNNENGDKKLKETVIKNISHQE